MTYSSRSTCATPVYILEKSNSDSSHVVPTLHLEDVGQTAFNPPHDPFFMQSSHLLPNDLKVALSLL